jgi:hypothetical protein
MTYAVWLGASQRSAAERGWVRLCVELGLVAVVTRSR